MRLFSCSAILAVALGGCATTVTHTQYVVRQAELVPGVSAPLITGPGLPAGSVSFTAGAQNGIAGQGSSRDDGNIGSVIADAAGRFAVGYSSRHLDVAIGAELRSGSAAHAAASDIDTGQFAHEWMLVPTAAFRGRIPLSDGLELGLVADLSIGATKYSRDTLTDSTTTTYYPNGSTQTSRWSDATHDSGIAWVPLFRTGPMFSWRFGKVFGLSAGMLFVTEPYVEGVTVVSQTCVDYSCSGSTPADVPVVQYALGAVPFLAPTLQLGDSFRLIAQVFGNLATDQRLTQAAPGGGEVMVQARF